MPPPQRPGNRRELEQHREEVVGGGSVLAASSHLITDVAKDGGGVSPLPPIEESAGTGMSCLRGRNGQGRATWCPPSRNPVSPARAQARLWSAASTSTDPKGNGDTGPV